MNDNNHCASLTTPIIGYHRSALTQKFGIPRQPNLVALPSYVKMVAPYNTFDAFAGIEAFSHLWITWHTHQNQEQHVFKPKVRPPRLGGNSKVGVFATRSTYRPSQLGLSVVKLTAIEATNTGVIVHIRGADMVDGTPIIDIKPYIAYSDAIAEAQSGFAIEQPIQRQVKIIELLKKQLNAMMNNEHVREAQKNSLRKIEKLNLLNDSSLKYSPNEFLQTDIDIICQLIAQDPRPAYRQQDSQRVYVMRYKNYDINFKMDDEDDEVLWIVAISKLI